MDFLLIGVGTLAFLLALSIPVAHYGRARRSGYRAPGAAAAVLASALVAVSLTILVLDIVRPTDFDRAALLTSIVGVASLWIAGRVVLAVLPRRTGRVFGQRHVAFPFALVGWIVTGAGTLVGVVGLLWWFSEPETAVQAARAVPTAITLVALGQYLVRRARSLKVAPPLEDVIADDPRPPVLYLRAFNQESAAFAVGDASRYGAFAEGWQQVASAGQRIEIPFEQYFHKSFEQLGPFVGLGSPEDYVPPHGAVRQYATDATWQRELAKLARRARCIVAEIGASKNLRWEFEYLRSHRLQKKLFLFSPPENTVAPWRSALGRFFGELRGLVPPMEWKSFSAELTSLGYELSLEDPGPGSLITFDSKGRQVLLTTEADLPDEFVEPLATWLDGGAKTGRCVPARCSRCKRSFHVQPGAESASLLCRRCRSPHRTLRGAAAALLATAMVFFGARVFDGSFESWLKDNSMWAEHPRIIAVAILGVLFVVFLCVMPYEGDARR